MRRCDEALLEGHDEQQGVVLKGVNTYAGSKAEVPSSADPQNCSPENKDSTLPTRNGARFVLPNWAFVQTSVAVAKCVCVKKRSNSRGTSVVQGARVAFPVQSSSRGSEGQVGFRL